MYSGEGFGSEPYLWHLCQERPCCVDRLGRKLGDVAILSRRRRRVREQQKTTSDKIRTDDNRMRLQSW